MRRAIAPASGSIAQAPRARRPWPTGRARGTSARSSPSPAAEHSTPRFKASPMEAARGVLARAFRSASILAASFVSASFLAVACCAASFSAAACYSATRLAAACCAALCAACCAPLCAPLCAALCAAACCVSLAWFGGVCASRLARGRPGRSVTSLRANRHPTNATPHKSVLSNATHGT
jgi:hypothetical protein